MSRRNKKKFRNSQKGKVLHAKSPENSLSIGKIHVPSKSIEIMCETPLRCFFIVVIFWSSVSLLTISLLTNAYAIPLSLSDANIIRFGTNLQDYLLGETSSLNHKRYLQREVMIQEQRGIWFMAVSLIFFGAITCYVKFSRFCEINLILADRCKDFFCAKNIFLHAIVPTIWGTLLSLFGILITIFSLWSSAL